MTVDGSRKRGTAPSVSVVTIAWQTAAHAPGFVTSLAAAAAAAPHVPTDVVVVVNGPDGEDSVDAFAGLARDGLPVTVLRLPGNTGFAGGATAGAAAARGDIVVVANLDLRFDGA